MKRCINHQNTGYRALPTWNSCSVFQCTVEDHQTSTHDTEDSTSNSGIDSDIVVFGPDVKPNSPDEYKYHLKNPILQAVDSAQKLDYARRLDDLGNNTV